MPPLTNRQPAAACLTGREGKTGSPPPPRLACVGTWADSSAACRSVKTLPSRGRLVHIVYEHVSTSKRLEGARVARTSSDRAQPARSVTVADFGCRLQKAGQEAHTDSKRRIDSKVKRRRGPMLLAHLTKPNGGPTCCARVAWAPPALRSRGSGWARAAASRDCHHRWATGLFGIASVDPQRERC
jgi:hypothetical protein